jgi:hypothetical protein
MYNRAMRRLANWWFRESFIFPNGMWTFMALLVIQVFLPDDGVWYATWLLVFGAATILTVGGGFVRQMRRLKEDSDMNAG